MKKNAKSNTTRSKVVSEQFHSNNLAEQNPVTSTQEALVLPPPQFVHEFIDTDAMQMYQVDAFQATNKALEVYDDLPPSWDSFCGFDTFSFLGIESHDMDLFDAGEMLPPHDDRLFALNSALILPPPHPDHLPAWKRCLLLHCEALTRLLKNTSVSENIAGEMIACDGPHNGWRHFVLPVAEHDELVMDAVLAVSLFHSPQVLQDLPATGQPEQDHYARAIQGLQKRSQLSDCDKPNQHSILLTILLLLTAVMVNGSSDFPILFGVLQSAIDAIGGDMELGSGGIAEFLARQIHK
ncbi:hypothetical protein ACHAPA_011070 [Fusarium lateritium]